MPFATDPADGVRTIYGAEDDDMAGHARRAAQEVPGARFLALPGATHLTRPTRRP